MRHEARRGFRRARRIRFEKPAPFPDVAMRPRADTVIEGSPSFLLPRFSRSNQTVGAPPVVCPEQSRMGGIRRVVAGMATANVLSCARRTEKRTLPLWPVTEKSAIWTGSTKPQTRTSAQPVRWLTRESPPLHLPCMRSAVCVAPRTRTRPPGGRDELSPAQATAVGHRAVLGSRA